MDQSRYVYGKTRQIGVSRKQISLYGCCCCCCCCQVEKKDRSCSSLSFRLVSCGLSIATEHPLICDLISLEPFRAHCSDVSEQAIERSRSSVQATKIGTVSKRPQKVQWRLTGWRPDRRGSNGQAGASAGVYWQLVPVYTRTLMRISTEKLTIRLGQHTKGHTKGHTPGAHGQQKELNIH